MADETTTTPEAQNPMWSAILEMIKQQATSNPAFLQQMQTMLQSQQISGTTSPAVEQATLAQQMKGAQDSIGKTMSNPADARAYPGFEQNPMKYLPTITGQESALKSALAEAQDNWKQQNPGRTEATEPAYLKPNNAIPSYMQQRALDWRTSHPQASDMGSGADSISYEGLKAVGDQAAAKYGDQYAPRRKWATP